MRPEPQTGLFLLPARLNKSLAAKLVIFALLLAVAGLATMAKNGQYFPDTSPAHYVSISTKLNVAHSPVRSATRILRPVTSFFRLQAPMRAAWVDHSTDVPLIIRLCLNDSEQLRAPPAVRS